ncbi:MAG: hypothetical protein H0X33_10480 [Taibaiella sp.]|nr:hypothetical protein [Taibaiella sp.]
MKKSFLGFIALGILFGTSCKKSSSSSTTGSGKGSWKVGSNTYNVVTVLAPASSGTWQLLASTGQSGASINTISFIFFKMPTVSGSYRVVDGVSDSGNEVQMVSSNINGSSNTTYASTSTGNVNATITVTGGKVSISMPDTWAQNLSTTTDSVKISANAVTQ